jgi:hypothetical protein
LRFARACRLSIKALRHYDEVGLLPPARRRLELPLYARSQITRPSRSVPARRAHSDHQDNLDARAKGALPSGSMPSDASSVTRAIAPSTSYVERMMREGDVALFDRHPREPAATLLSPDR